MQYPKYKLISYRFFFLLLIHYGENSSINFLVDFFIFMDMLSLSSVNSNKLNFDIRLQIWFCYWPTKLKYALRKIKSHEHSLFSEIRFTIFNVLSHYNIGSKQKILC